MARHGLYPSQSTPFPIDSCNQMAYWALPLAHTNTLIMSGFHGIALISLGQSQARDCTNNAQHKSEGMAPGTIQLVQLATQSMQVYLLEGEKTDPCCPPAVDSKWPDFQCPNLKQVPQLLKKSFLVRDLPFGN